MSLTMVGTSIDCTNLKRVGNSMQLEVIAKKNSELRAEPATCCLQQILDAQVKGLLNNNSGMQ
jgi:hypothetical protein